MSSAKWMAGKNFLLGKLGWGTFSENKDREIIVSYCNFFKVCAPIFVIYFALEKGHQIVLKNTFVVNPKSNI